MYRPPVNPGFDVIGAAITAGLDDARASLRRNRAEQEDRDRYRAEQERQKRLDAIAEAERARRTAIENAEMGVVGEEQAYDPIQAAVAVAPERRPDERPQDWVSRMGETAVRPRRLREGVVQTGGLYIDPRAGLGYRRQQIAREDERGERQRQITENAARIRGLAPTMSEDEAIARAMGLSVAAPVTEDQALAQTRREMELRDEFARRQEAREFARARMLAGIRASGGGAQPRSVAKDSLQGMALTLAYDVARLPERERTAGREMRAGFDPLAYVRGRLRQQAARAGLRVTEGQIQEEALRALYAVQDQERQHTYAPRDPNAVDEWEVSAGGDPITAAVTAGARPPGQEVVVRRTRTPSAPQGSGSSSRAVGPGITREARDALRAGAGEQEVRSALRGRGYTEAQVDEIIAGAK